MIDIILENCLQLEKRNDENLMVIRKERPYIIPPKYLQWRLLSSVVAMGTYIWDANKRGDLSLFFLGHSLSLWLVKNAPIYCLDASIIQAFKNTDFEEKASVLRQIKPSLYSFMLLLEKESVVSGEGKPVEFLSCHVCLKGATEENGGRLGHFKVSPLVPECDLLVHLSTTDTAGNVYFSGIGINPDGSIFYDKEKEFGLHTSKGHSDQQFLSEMRSIVLQTLFVLQFKPDLLTAPLPPLPQKPKGFAKPLKLPPIEISNHLYPRVLSLPEKIENPSSTPKPGSKHNYHAPHSPHVRRGHWRIITTSDNTTKMIWVKPTFVGRANK